MQIHSLSSSACSNRHTPLYWRDKFTLAAWTHKSKAAYRNWPKCSTSSLAGLCKTWAENKYKYLIFLVLFPIYIIQKQFSQNDQRKKKKRSMETLVCTVVWLKHGNGANASISYHPLLHYLLLTILDYAKHFETPLDVIQHFINESWLIDDHHMSSAIHFYCDLKTQLCKLP